MERITICSNVFLLFEHGRSCSHFLLLLLMYHLFPLAFLSYSCFFFLCLVYVNIKYCFNPAISSLPPLILLAFDLFCLVLYRQFHHLLILLPKGTNLSTLPYMIYQVYLRLLITLATFSGL